MIATAEVVRKPNCHSWASFLLCGPIPLITTGARIMFATKIRTDVTSPVGTGSSARDESSPKPTLKKPRSWWRFLGDLVFYFAVYLMLLGISIGPFFWTWFGAMYADGPKWVARLYLPLLMLCEICPPLRWVVNEWVNWWIL
jgi:hypothetical protein